MVENGIGLEKYTKLVGEGLHGNHPAYDAFIEFRLSNFTKSNSTDARRSVFRYVALKASVIACDNAEIYRQK